MKYKIDISGEPIVSVGIVAGQTLEFGLNAPYRCEGMEVEGDQKVTLSNDLVHWKDRAFKELSFRPAGENASFSLKDVIIGINFHWERAETQTFFGELKFIIEGGKIQAVNELPVEKYLESVISSEMSATSSLELLKAHAVISRSWLIDKILKRRNHIFTSVRPSTEKQPGNELIKWYDSDNHTLYDVCADDHCQRYQGITKETSENVKKAIEQTRGQLLMYEGEICDARFSKSCGGVSEEYEYCWDDTPRAYLEAVRDTADESADYGDLTKEENAEEWIRTSPESFCNTDDDRILSQVLNDYDQETKEFYRWKVEYTQDEISSLLNERLGTDFGPIVDLIPVERGKSGRISRLKVVGTKRELVIGKELVIRRALSNTHLYSSAFVVDKLDVENLIPRRFVLLGAGWGHGVGLCQIGAAVMGEKGYPYEEILSHYYHHAEITKLYE